MKSIILLALFMLPIALVGQELIYPKIPKDLITGLHFIDENEVIFINEGGSIFKSYNGGVTWELIEFFPDYSLDEMHFLNDHTGFIKASNGLLYTTDSGENWEHQQVSLFGNCFLPLSESRIIKSLPEGGIFLLDNFFNHWTQTYFYEMFTDSGYDYTIDRPYGNINQFEMLPSGSILALGINDNAYYHGLIENELSLILRSDDFGSSWDTLEYNFSSFLYNISFSSDSIGWANSYSEIFKTTNGGKDWFTTSIPEINYWISDILAVADNKLYVINSSQFIRTEDSGASWDTTSLNFSSFYNLSFYNENNGFLFGSDLIKTHDGGQTWSKIDSSIDSDIYDIDFTSLNYGLALGSNGLYKTNDGGYSWSKQLDIIDIVSNRPGSLKMINDTLGWLITHNQLYKTINGGLTWDTIEFSDKEQHYQGFEFYDENLGIIFSVSEEDTPRYFTVKRHYITKDGGRNWRSVSIAPDTISRYPGYYDKMKFTDPGHLWAINSYGLWLSQDTSKTWKPVFTRSFNGSYSFDFYDSLTGIITNSGHYVYFTNDGGKTWQTLGRGINSSANDIKILGPNYFGRFRVLEAGKDLLRYYIDNDGVISDTRKLNSYTSNELNNIFVLEQDNFPYVWIAGNGFTILYRQWELIHTGIENDTSVLQTYFLEQNYPNPFNPLTKIKFSIDTPGLVKLIVYNTLGQQVKTLVNEYKNAGKYEVQFNATDLPSGIYFYRLESGSFKKVKKMVVIK